MSRHQIIRAWKDPEYRSNLSKVERDQLPAHPAGLILVPDDDLVVVAGGLAGKYTPHCTDPGMSCDCTAYCNIGLSRATG